MTKLYLNFCAFFLFAMMFFPRTYSSHKAVMLGIILFVILIFFTKKIKMNNFVFIWIIAFILYYSLWITIGSLNGAKGAIDYFRVNIVWVLLYALFISVINESFVQKIFKTIMLTNFLICVHVFIAFLTGMGIVNPTLISMLDTGTNVGIHTGYSQITSHHIGTLFFTAPFVIILTMFSYYKTKKENHLPLTSISFIFLLINSLSSLLIIFISGRRALLFSVVISLLLFILYLFIKQIGKIKKENSYSLSFLLKIYLTPAISLFTLYLISYIYKYFNPNWEFSLYLERINTAITLNGESARSDQLMSFYRNIAENPFLGTGFGIGLPDFVRDFQKPWVYEYSYHLLAYNTGVIGLLIYFTLIFIMIIKFCRVRFLNKEYKIAILVGFISFMIGNYSNPYLQSFDFMWVLFLPLLLINLYEEKKVAQ